MSFFQLVILYCLIGVGWCWRYDYHYKRDPSLHSETPFWVQLTVIVVIWPILFLFWMIGPHKNPLKK